MTEFPYAPSNRNPVRGFWIAVFVVALIGNAAYWYIRYPEKDAAGGVSNPDSRFQRLLKEAKLGVARSRFKVARALETGDGISVDPKQAAYWYEQAARQGHVPAILIIAQRYEKGDGVPQNYMTAARWYRLAAGLGNDMRAQFALGDLFFNGRGVPQDYGEAINWYGKAANQGHPVAQYLMGVLYREGWGADHDPMEAYKWFFLASRHREEVRKASKKYNPERARANLAAKLNRSQIKEAEKQAEAWLDGARR